MKPAFLRTGKTKNGGGCLQGVAYYIINGVMKCSGRNFLNTGFIGLAR